MLRYVLIFLITLATVNVSAIKCSDVNAKGRALTLSEKYCDSSNAKADEELDQTKANKDAHNRQLRQERFLGANPHSQQKLQEPDRNSQPGFQLPKPFVPPTQNKSGAWDYLK